MDTRRVLIAVLVVSACSEGVQVRLEPPEVVIGNFPEDPIQAIGLEPHHYLEVRGRSLSRVEDLSVTFVTSDGGWDATVGAVTQESINIVLPRDLGLGRYDVSIRARGTSYVGRGAFSVISSHDADADADTDTHADADTHADSDDGTHEDLDADGQSDGDSIVQDVTAIEDELLSALQAQRVRAIARDGEDLEYDIAIVDEDLLEFIDCAITLRDAPEGTRSWVGDQPCVTLIFSINAADREDASTGDDDWYSCGMLIRSVTLLPTEMLEVSPDLSVSDMDFIDVTDIGEFERRDDYATPVDTEIDPQLVNAVNRVKEVVVQTLRP